LTECQRPGGEVELSKELALFEKKKKWKNAKENLKDHAR